MLIGICGKKGAGKDTIGHILVDKLNLRPDSFAAPIKDAAMDWFGLSREQCFGSMEQKETVDPRWGRTPREVMQLLGTEVARSIHPDVWARALIQRHQQAMVMSASKWEHGPGAYRPVGTVVTDLRFGNEARILRENGAVILYIVREADMGDPQFSSHASEVEISTVGETADHVIQNFGTLEDLTRTVLGIAHLLGGRA